MGIIPTDVIAVRWRLTNQLLIFFSILLAHISDDEFYFVFCLQNPQRRSVFENEWSSFSPKSSEQVLLRSAWTYQNKSLAVQELFMDAKSSERLHVAWRRSQIGGLKVRRIKPWSNFFGETFDPSTNAFGTSTSTANDHKTTEVFRRS